MTDFIDELISIGEGYQSEFKESPDKSLVKEVCAFANAAGGKILVGVKDNGEKKLLTLDNNLLSRIQDSINHIEPKISVKLIKHDGILVIDVPEGTKKPYLCPDGFYLRIGPNSQKVSRDVILEMFRHSGEIQFDSLENKRADFAEDFDIEAYNKFLDEAGITHKLDPQIVLKNLGCLTGSGKFTNAGVLFFTKSVEFILGQAVCTCVLYKGIDKVKILDRKDFKTNMLNNIDNAVSFVERHTNVEYVIEKIRREDVPEIPKTALREAIINAFCHKLYFHEGSNITVEIFDDRVSITSYGSLPYGLPPEEFGKISIQRNPLIASLLLRVHYIEKVGTGIQRIKDDVALLGKGKVTFEFSSNFFIVTFTRTPYKAAPKSEKIIIPEQLTLLQQEVLELFKNNRDALFASEEISQLLKNKYTVRFIRTQLSSLQKAGHINYTGATRARKWFLIK